MRTTERLRAIKEWTYENLCKGRMMKAPSPDMDITQIYRQEPKVFLGWQPSRPDITGYQPEDPWNVCPSILIMPTQSYAMNMIEKRFDRYNKIMRPKQMGQQFSCQFLFSVYEPGIRLPGFNLKDGIESNIDVTRIMEGTEQGLMTLCNWMDDLLEGLIGTKMIPNSDLMLDETSVKYSLAEESGYIVDKRPIFYGFVVAEFVCYAEDGGKSALDDYLK